MPEGVECLVVSESIKNWMSNIDVNKLGFLKFNVSTIVDDVVCQFSPIDFTQFNSCFKYIDYTKIHTFGKLIFFPSANNYYLCIRLGMTGNFNNTSAKHDRVIFNCNGNEFYYNDIRKFGHLMLYGIDQFPRNIYYLLKNAIEWRSKNAAEEFVSRMHKGHYRHVWINKPIKHVLMNQQIIAGIGNIYANEALHLSRVHPCAIANTLSDVKLHEIIQNCQKIMLESYKLNGMTVKDFKFFGKKGHGQDILKIYGKKGRLCSLCNSSIIQYIRVDNRSTYFCPRCQKMNL